MKITFTLLILVLLVGSLCAEEPSEGEKLFALEVKPLFAEKCNACHGDEPDKIKGEFDMRTREAILKGGDYFAEDVLIAGKGEESFLYVLTTRTEEDYEMPPKEADQLTEAQRWSIRDWINEGAPWVDDERVALIQEQYAEGEQVVTSKALSDDWQNRRYETEKLWAYRPLKVAEVPEGENPVDYFISRKLKEAGLEAAPAANALELARRISFGLTGLPPKPKQVEDFKAAYSADQNQAVKELAAALMATPQYGEHFGRQWLDVTRYADTAGFANDYTRPNAWRYRDYVVRSFNEDKPYNAFVKEQIAGDEMDESDPEKLVATGFLRMGPWEQTGMSVFRETRQQWLDDVTDATGQVFLAHAMQCAKCHDHKFDPLPTRDYYSMMAVFSTTQFADREAPFLEKENKGWFNESDQWVKAKLASYQQQHKALQAKVNNQKKKESGDAKVGDNGLDPGDEASLGRMKKNISRHQWELDRTRPIAFSVYTGNTIEIKNVSNRINHPGEGIWKKGELEQAAILAGGNAFSPTDPVSPGALSAADSLGAMDELSFPDGKGKRRLALAEWIVSEKNPLTARVLVNRIWAWHFGKGIAGNPNNFGGTGAPPTHPELLDYLANWFMENDWSIKRLNEMIVTSDAYRRSSKHPQPEALAEKDPKQALYAAFLPRRLTAEEFRDAMLATSGELSYQVGGIPARPDVNVEVAFQPRQIMGGTASVYEPDPLPQQRNRRSIYAEKMRGLRDPFYETFNQPGPDNSCELRETSTVAPQALTLFNSEEILERATALANRVLKETNNQEKAIHRAFHLSLGRRATEGELAASLAHWKEAIDEESGKEYVEKVFQTEIKRTVMAEKTGEPYDFIEIMPAFEIYQPDLTPGKVDAETRGLAHLCLVLFNLNEFAYLD
ncbi:PSD1 and planctomycete cytochrome C domain-containing protein [Verrucomicrobiales bacterium]|nr:PSD1 and planctomycete cytochrome C domain-containing protein [Verrucomicrobiales bacterium]MDB4358948.1 PSD1 and planctomycete cytochrome C domain-containing protein [Verrucomicrobiales bacterium]